MPPVFVGRDREQAELLAALQDAASGRGNLFLISGGPGIGKTALADRLAIHAVERGVRVVWGRCWEGGGAPPYAPWTEIIRALAQSYDDDAPVWNLGSAAPYLARLVPELTDRFGQTAAGLPSPNSEAARFSLFEAIARFLRNASSLEPLLLVLDDLHAADPASFLLLRFLARGFHGCRLLMVATFRDVDLNRSPEGVEVFGDLIREGELLSLEGLSGDEIRDLITRLSGAVPREEKVTAIEAATEGNPLFVREVVRLLASRDELQHPGQLTLPIPESVRAVIQRRLVPLSVDAVQMLAAAAVVGRDFDLSVVGHACDLPTDGLLGGLSEAMALGLVNQEPVAVGRYRFSHALINEVIYQQIPVPARMQIHRRVGEGIERQYGSESDDHLAELAHHFTNSAPGHDAKAREYAVRAGERAMHSHAYEQAASHFRQALQLLESAGPDGNLRCELLLRFGAAQAGAGDYQHARQSYLEAAEIARKVGSPQQLAKAALGFGEPQVEGSLVNRQLIELLEEALGVLSPQDHPLRARLLARLSVEYTFSEDTALRDPLSRESLDMARRLGDVAALGSALRARWAALWTPDRLDERSALAEEIVRLAREAGDREMELLGRARRASCSLEAGDIQVAEADIAAHGRLAEELQMPLHQWNSTTMRGMLALLRGSFHDAELLADQALSLQPDRPTAQFAHLYQVALIRWEQDRLGELRMAWQQLVEQFPQVALARAWLALAEVQVGQDDLARTELRAVVDALADPPRDGLWLPTLPVASLVCARLNDPDAAAGLYPILDPYAERIITFAVPQPVMCLGAASLHLALLATVMGRWELAEAHFTTAQVAHDRLRARAFQARTDYERARMLIRRGRAADRNQAARLLDRALAMASALGMSEVESQVQRLGQFPVGHTITTDQGGDIIGRADLAGSNLFRREGDYWTIAYDGKLVRLRDSKGLHYLARLLANPGRELHAVDIEAEAAPVAHAAASSLRHWGHHGELDVRIDLGDAGELLDAQAKAAYKARLQELQAELDEAESFNDPDRATRAKEEMEFLVSELARAVGLSGRDRKAASHAERARLNVTRAIRSAIANIGQVNQPLGQHLSTTIRTGRYCSYTPDPRVTIDWEL
jgi:tetratricopeptide (TPR) repeat protein